MSDLFSPKPKCKRPPNVRRANETNVDGSAPTYLSPTSQSAAISLATLFNAGKNLSQDSAYSSKSDETTVPESVSSSSAYLLHQPQPSLKQERSRNKNRHLLDSSSHKSFHYNGISPLTDIDNYPHVYNKTYPIGFSSPRKKSRRLMCAHHQNPLMRQENHATESAERCTISNINSTISNISQSTPQRVANILASELPFSRDFIPIISQESVACAETSNFPSRALDNAVASVSIGGREDGSYRMQKLMEATKFASPLAGARTTTFTTVENTSQFDASFTIINKLDKPSSLARKEKSLGLLCQNFLELFREAGGETGAVVDICEVAALLGAKRRRIYDIINIMESVGVVSRIKKNTYNWHGTEGLPKFFAELQRDALRTTTTSNDFPEDPPRGDEDFSNTANNNSVKSKGMANTCQRLIQLFLVTGKVEIGLTDAAEEVLGPLTEADVEKPGKPKLSCTGGETLATLTASTASAASTTSTATTTSTASTANAQSATSAASSKVMKTKIRRMYDIANVLQSLGIIQKENVGSSSSKKKPSFRWVYPLLPKDVSQFLPDVLPDGGADDRKDRETTTPHKTSEISPDVVHPVTPEEDVNLSQSVDDV